MPNPRRSISLVAFALSLHATAAMGAPPPLPPEKMNDPTEATNQAVALVQKGDMEQALLYFQHAFSLANKAFDTAANLGVAELALGRYRDAATHLTMAIERIPASQQERKSRLLTRLNEAKAHVATLRIKTDAEYGMIVVDDVPVQPVTSTTPVFLDPGPHFVQLKGPQGDSDPVEIIGEPGKELGLVLRLKPEEKEPEAPAPTLEAEQDDASFTPAQVATIVSGALTIAAGGVALGLFVRQSTLDGQVDDLRESIAAQSGTPSSGCFDPAVSLAPTCTELRSTLESRNDLVTPSNAMGWSTLGLGVLTGGLLTYVLFFEEPSEPGADELGVSHLTLRPTLNAHFGALHLGGRW